MMMVVAEPVVDYVHITAEEYERRIGNATSQGIRHAISASIVALRRAQLIEKTINGAAALGEAADGFQAMLDEADRRAAMPPEDPDEVVEGVIVDD
jgi:hypothetical protein